MDWGNLRPQDGETRYQAFMRLLETTKQPMDWAYEVWDELIANLSHKDNHQRAIAAQLLSNMAKSDPRRRMLKDFSALLAAPRDERFGAARHCLQSLWKIGAVGKKHRKMVVEWLTTRFVECVAEKDCALIRYDIIQGLRKLYDATGDGKVREKALKLIETEQDLKYRKKYAGLWKTKWRSWTWPQKSNFHSHGRVVNERAIQGASGDHHRRSFGPGAGHCKKASRRGRPRGDA